MHLCSHDLKSSSRPFLGENCDVFYLTLSLEDSPGVVASSGSSFEPIKMLGRWGTWIEPELQTNDAAIHCSNDCLGAIARAQLAQNVADMKPDRTFRNLQVGANLPVILAFCGV